MHGTAFVLIMLAALPCGAAFGQQAPKPEVSDELRLACRDAARKICNPGVPPNREVFRQCVREDRDKLPAQCAALFAARQ
jgi:hypothetical protein